MIVFIYIFIFVMVMSAQFVFIHCCIMGYIEFMNVFCLKFAEINYHAFTVVVFSEKVICLAPVPYLCINPATRCIEFPVF